MNLIEKIPDRSRNDSGSSRLALAATCAIVITAAIDEQLALQSSDRAVVVPPDCVRCIETTAAAAGRLQGSSLVADESTRALGHGALRRLSRR